MTVPPPPRGYAASKDQLQARLRAGRGAGAGHSADDRRGPYCIDVLTQISAIQAALDKVALGLLDGHARHCVGHAEPDQIDERVTEMMAAVGA